MLSLLAALLLAATGAGGPPAAPAQPCALILSTNDTHGHLLPSKPAWFHHRKVGGVALIEAYFRRAMAATDCPAFIFSAGDVMQGTPVSNFLNGRSTIAVFDSMGYDAASFGNHEFDWGIDTLRARLRQADFPFLGANIFVKGTDRHPSWARPYAIVERGGVRIGVVGVTTRSTPWTTMPSNVSSLEFRSLSAALDRYVPVVRSRGVDFVVVVLHAGGFCKDHGRDCHGEAIDALRATHSRWDYAITGHTHTLIQTRIRGRPVVQSYANAVALGEGRLTRVSPDSVDAKLLRVQTAWPDSVRPDPAIAALVGRYESRVAAQARRPVATLAVALPKTGSDAEYALGDLIADAQRAATRTQIAIMNNGGIRRSLPAGPVTYGQLFELQPFGNTLVRMDVTGRTLRSALAHALVTDGPHAHVSGLTVCYEPDAARGRRIRSLILAGGEPVRPDSTYSLTVNDFMATGGAGFSMLGHARSSTNTGITDLEALIRYLQHRPQPVRAPVPDRWVSLARLGGSQCSPAGRTGTGGPPRRTSPARVVGR